MKALLWCIFIALLIAFQGSILNPLQIKGIRPDFILIAVYLLGIFKGEIKGGLMGAFLGFIMDVISAGPVYYNVFSKFFIGYLSGIIARWVQNPGFLLQGGLIFLLSLLQGLGIFLTLAFLGMAQFPGDIIFFAIPQALFDGFLGGVTFLFLIYRKRATVSRWA